MKRKLKIIVFDSKSYTIDAFRNTEHADITFTYVSEPLNINNVKLVKGYDAICTFVNDDISISIIDELVNNNIRYIFARCSGTNNIDMTYINKVGIKVYNVPSYSPNAIAEYVFALIGTSNRRIHKAYNRTREYNFSLENLVGENLEGKTIGVIGTGKIGSRVIDIALGYHMHVLAYDLYPINNDNRDYRYVSLLELLIRSDYITLHIPLTKDTYHMINKESFKVMKNTAMIINTSRGALIDSKALLHALRYRKISSAVLDVYEEENNIFFNDKSNHILDDQVLTDLLALPNVIITSHQAFLTKEALDEIARTTIHNIRKAYDSF